MSRRPPEPGPSTLGLAQQGQPDQVGDVDVLLGGFYLVERQLELAGLVRRRKSGDSGMMTIDNL